MWTWYGKLFTFRTIRLIEISLLILHFNRYRAIHKAILKTNLLISWSCSLCSCWCFWVSSSSVTALRFFEWSSMSFSASSALLTLLNWSFRACYIDKRKWWDYVSYEVHWCKRRQEINTHSLCIVSDRQKAINAVNNLSKVVSFISLVTTVIII